MSVCLKCGGTGFRYEMNSDGVFEQIPCECGTSHQTPIPVCMEVPMQYQGVKFDRTFVEETMPLEYGSFMEKLLYDCTDNLQQFHKNYILCAPPNSGKTIWSYTVYGLLFAKGIQIPEVMDLMQVREIMLNYYTEDKKALELLSTAPLAIIRLPWDLPNRFPETISTIIERRVRNNCSTIFLFNGTYSELMAKDTFGKLKLIKGDGSFNSVSIQSWLRKE